MIKLAIKLGTLAPVLMALSTAPSLTPALAAGGGGGGGGASSAMDPSPSYPPSSYPKRSGTKATHKVKKTNKQSSIDDPSFAQGYRAAYATIYDRNDYAAAIEQLKSLGHDDHPNVANLIGYPLTQALSRFHGGASSRVQWVDGLVACWRLVEHRPRATRQGERNEAQLDKVLV
jgi:hypothetical protein